MLTKTSEAQFRTEIAQYKEELDLSIINDEAEHKGRRTDKFNETEYSKIKELIPSFDRKYDNIIIVEDDKLVYKGNDKEFYRKAYQMDILSNKELVNDEILEELQPFITEWTVEAGDSITLPLYNYAHNKYNFTVDYGDGTEEKVVTSYDDADKIHSYEKAGTYLITIKGQCPAFSFNDESISKEKITGIKQWGNVIKNIGGLPIALKINFSGCTNLKGNLPDPTENSFKNVLSVEYMFNGCINLEGPIPENLFYNCKSNSFKGTFRDCKKIKEIPEKLFINMSNTINFEGTFAGCKGIKEIPEKLFVENINITNIGNGFEGCTELKSIPDNLFANCNKLKTCREAFLGCSNLETIGKNVFNSSENMDFYRAFENCSKLKCIPEDMFDNCPNVKTFIRTFDNCYGLTGEAPDIWNRTNVDGTGACFSGCKNLSNYNQIPSAWK